MPDVHERIDVALAMKVVGMRGIASAVEFQPVKAGMELKSPMSWKAEYVAPSAP